MPNLNLSELNIVLTVGGIFLAIFSYFSHFITGKLFISEACVLFLFPIMSATLTAWASSGGYCGNHNRAVGGTIRRAKQIWRRRRDCQQ
jgi:hypothetical protein